MTITAIDELISALPKAELHIHLEGSLEPEMVFALADRNGVSLDYESVETLREAYSFSNLQEFLDVYYAGMQVLQTENDFRDMAAAYFKRAALDNVRHAEVFFDPQAHTDRGIAIADVVGGITAAAAESGLSVYLIPCFLRHLSAEDAMRCLTQLEPFLEHITGVGLDSSELGHPPGEFAAVFAKARELGLKLVAHAGEEGPPQYVWDALDQLHVDRIDHGNRALEDEDLVARLCNDKTPLTVCPLSNLKLAVVDDLRNHPLRRMLDADMVVTVNSDDPAYFGGYINENFSEIVHCLRLSEDDVVALAKNSFKASFLPESEVQTHLESIDRMRTRR